MNATEKATQLAISVMEQKAPKPYSVYSEHGPGDDPHFATFAAAADCALQWARQHPEYGDVYIGLAWHPDPDGMILNDGPYAVVRKDALERLWVDVMVYRPAQQGMVIC